jgi:hypothetical protein
MSVKIHWPHKFNASCLEKNYKEARRKCIQDLKETLKMSKEEVRAFQTGCEKSFVLQRTQISLCSNLEYFLRDLTSVLCVPHGDYIKG